VVAALGLATLAQTRATRTARRLPPSSRPASSSRRTRSSRCPSARGGHEPRPPRGRRRLRRGRAPDPRGRPRAWPRSICTCARVAPTRPWPASRPCPRK
jgi:hypothetical protein